MFNINNIFKSNEERIQEQIVALEDRIILAEQVRNFFETDTGKYLEKCMEADIEDIKTKLLSIEPENEKEIQKLQNKFNVINKVRVYFGRAILAGNDAEKILLKQHQDLDE